MCFGVKVYPPEEYSTPLRAQTHPFGDGLNWRRAYGIFLLLLVYCRHFSNSYFAVFYCITDPFAGFTPSRTKQMVTDLRDRWYPCILVYLIALQICAVVVFPTVPSQHFIPDPSTYSGSTTGQTGHSALTVSCSVSRRPPGSDARDGEYGMEVDS